MNASFSDSGGDALTQARFHALINASGDAMIGKTVDGIVTSWNPAARAIFGYAAEEMIGRNILCLIPEELRFEEAEILRKIRQGERLARYETIRRRKSGEIFPASVTVSPILDAEGRVAGATKIARDLSEFTRLRDIHETFTENTPGLLAYWDSNLICRFANRGHAAWFGKSPEEIVGSHVTELFAAEYLTIIEPHIERVLRGEPRMFERKLVKPDGTTTHMLVRYAPDRDASGAVRGFSVMASDITQIKLVELKLAELNHGLRAERDQVAAADLMKSELLSDLGHELRTPLNAIIGFSALLLDGAHGPLTPDHRARVGTIRAAGEHLLNVLDGFVDFAKSESAGAAVSKDRARLGDLIQESLALCEPVFNKYGTRVEPRRDHGDQLVRCDPTRARQAIVNLLSNAAKHGRHGGMIRLATAKLVDGFERLVVTDTGDGIAPEIADRIFRPRDRKIEDIRRVEGSGLGLKISKALMDAMGGRIGFSSAPGAGSSFWLDFPADDRPAPAPVGAAHVGAAPVGEAPSSASLQGSVLYVDDDAQSRELMQAYFDTLQPDRLLLRTAASADEGQLIAVRHQPDLIIMDVNLRQVSGIDACAWLKSDERTRGIPIITLSADVSPAKRRLALESGAALHLDKPLLLPQLRHALATTLFQGANERGGASQAS